MPTLLGLDLVHSFIASRMQVSGPTSISSRRADVGRRAGVGASDRSSDHRREDRIIPRSGASPGRSNSAAASGARGVRRVLGAGADGDAHVPRPRIVTSRRPSPDNVNDVADPLGAIALDGATEKLDVRRGAAANARSSGSAPGRRSAAVEAPVWPPAPRSARATLPASAPAWAPPPAPSAARSRASRSIYLVGPCDCTTAAPAAAARPRRFDSDWPKGRAIGLPAENLNGRRGERRRAELLAD